jgi:hypothetical protein
VAVDLGKISLSPSAAWNLKIWEQFIVKPIRVSTSHNINYPGKKKCEAGLPPVLLLVLLPAELISQMQPGFEGLLEFW